MAIRSKPLMTALEHLKLIESLQCRAEKVKQLFGKAAEGTSNMVCAADGAKCYFFTPASPQNNGLWRVDATYNDRDYSLRVTQAGLQVYRQDDERDLELFSFTPALGVQAADPLHLLEAPGILLYFQDIIAAEGCKK